MTIGEKLEGYVAALDVMHSHLRNDPKDYLAIKSAQEVVEDKWRQLQKDFNNLDTIHCRIMYETRKVLEELR